MIFRLSTKLATKLKSVPAHSLPIDDNPYADWSATLFLADRAQYVLVTNTRSLYSMVMFGRGITNDSEFVKRAVSYLGELMEHDGYQFLRERAFLPETGTISFAKALNRSVIGSMNDLVHYAQVLLTESEISPFDVSFKLNEMPMSYLNYDVPRETFGKMRIEPAGGASE